MSVKLVVFDLDETLVHATKEPLAYRHDFEVAPYLIYVRPFAAELIEFCANQFDLAVWSSSSQVYVEKVTAELFGTRYPTKFSWAVQKCVQKVDARTNGYVYIKDLRKVQKHGYSVDEILMIDDSPEKLQRQPGRHLHIAPFTGNENDRELLSMVSRLETICG
jgi:carboxy-terminal domain RNA polymerase II polypeptide A small phosphatase